MIEARNLSFCYSSNGRRILKDVSFSLDTSEVLTVLGRNGAGKTTLLRCLTGEVQNYEGDILVNGRNLKTLDIKELSEMIALVASNSRCHQDLCVADYLLTGFANKLYGMRRPSKEMYERAYEALNGLGKGELFNKTVFTLSSGEMQIVKIARAVLQNPSMIMFDEPTSNLDVRNQMMVIEQIANLAEQGYTLITTTHNPGHAIELKSKVLMLFDEQRYVFASQEEAMNEGALQDLYQMKVQAHIDEHRRYCVFTDQKDTHHLYY